MRMTWIAALCLALAVPLAADVRDGNLDEEFRADVAVQTVEANRVLMTIDNRGESRFGAVNCVFAIRSEGAFAAPVSLRLTNARVIVRADHVVAIADDGRAVIVGMFNSTWGQYPAAVSWQVASQQAREDVISSAAGSVNAPPPAP